MLPKIFIGCSDEGLPVAEAIQRQLYKFAEAKIWNQGVFPLSGNTLSSLIKGANKFDFGIFLFTPDDVAEIRGSRYLIARDNVIFELGLFMGILGKHRGFIVVPDMSPRIHLPSDLNGITFATYDASSSDLAAAVVTATYDIKQAVKMSQSSKKRVPYDLVEGARLLLHSLRDSKSQTEFLAATKTFLGRVVFHGKQIRVAFAKKVHVNNLPVLRVIEPYPSLATHNLFSYPHTIASWALVEGKIFSIPRDLDRRCDFGLIERLGKLDRVTDVLVSLDSTKDPIAADYLNLDKIKTKTDKKTLALRDIYQNWVGRQPSPHYSQFISVPVPVIDRISNSVTPPEYGVINIDTKETEKLLDERTIPLLKLTSDTVALGFEILENEDVKR